MPISAVDAISPAFHHTRQQLFQPFRFWQWARLAVVGLLAGEVSSGGGCNSIQIPQVHDGGQRFAVAANPLANVNPALYAGLIALLVILGVVLWLLLIYANSMMRFVLFDSVVAKECHIRQSWNRRLRPGLRYFGWQLMLMAGMMGTLVILLGIPAAIAFAMGWLDKPSQHLAPLILGGIVLFFMFFVFVVVFLVGVVLTKDFVVPQMALEGIGVLQGWKRLWSGIKSDKGNYAAYIGLKVLMALGAAIVFGIIAFIVVLIFMIPIAGLGVIAVISGKSAGITPNAYIITLAVLFGVFAVAVLLYVLSLISVPAIVFFPAYSIHFFASRYPPLDAVLHPALPVPPAPELTLAPEPPPEPPPIPPDFSPSVS